MSQTHGVDWRLIGWEHSGRWSNKFNPYKTWRAILTYKGEEHHGTTDLQEQDGKVFFKSDELLGISNWYDYHKVQCI